MMFRFAHCTHPDWREALELVLVQLDGQMQLEQFASDASRRQKVGLLYCTEAYAESLDDMVTQLRRRTGITVWSGAVAPGVCSSAVEYFQEPALAVMLLELPADSVRLFSGKKPLPKPGTLTASGRNAMAAALVHIDPMAEDIDDLLDDLSIKTGSARLFGGLVSAGAPINHLADEALSGGLSGLLFSESVDIEVRMTQGVAKVGGEHQITAMRGNFVESLDGRPALDVLLEDIGIDMEGADPEGLQQATELLARRFEHGLYVGLTDRSLADSLDLVRFSSVRAEPHQLKVRPVVGVDPQNKSLAIAEEFSLGDRLTFCTRDESSAKADLTRMCAELRDELEAAAPKLNTLQAAGFAGLHANRQPRGAVYVLCNGRGANLFGHQGAELQILREQLGDIPLIGFFANGEIFNGALYGYTGVLILFF